MHTRYMQQYFRHEKYVKKIIQMFVAQFWMYFIFFTTSINKMFTAAAFFRKES